VNRVSGQRAWWAGAIAAAALMLCGALSAAAPELRTTSCAAGGGEVVALFTAVRGNVTPETVWQWPESPPEDFDFHIRTMVRLKVTHALRDCRNGDVFTIPSPQQRNPYRPPYTARFPILIEDGQQVLAYLRCEHGEYVASSVTRAYGGKLLAVVSDKGDQEMVPIARAVEITADRLRRNRERDTYDPTAKTSAELVADLIRLGIGVQRRILPELVARGDAGALADLLVKLRDGDPTHARYDVMRELTSIPGAAPVPYLAAILTGPDRDLWSRAAWALDRPEGEAAVPELGDALHRTEPPEFADRHRAIAIALGVNGEPEGISELIELARKPGDVASVSGFIHALSRSRRPETEAFLLQCLRDVKASLPEMRTEADRYYAWMTMFAAASALAKWGNEVGLTELIEIARDYRLHDEATGYWEAITKALVDAHDPRTVAVLIEALRTSSPAVAPAQTVRALVRIGDERAVEPLIAAVRGRRGEPRARLIAAVGEWDQPQITALLASELTSDDRLSVSAAALALHKLGDPRGAERLLELLDLRLVGWSPPEKGPLYQALGEIKEQRAVPALIAMMSKNKQNREEIAEALRAITGADLPARPEAWREWEVSRKQ
jgi:HEAT repeat protein